MPRVSWGLITAAASMLAACHGVHPSPRPAVAPSAVADSLPPGLREGAHEVVIDGVRLWYRVAGRAPADAPPVVFLHGGPGQGSQSFAALVGPSLEPHLRMVYFDQRGSGRSERPWNQAYSIPILVEDIEGLRRALGVPRIAIIAQSFGGVLGLEYAARYPQHVSRMVIAAGLSDAPASMRGMCALLAESDPAAHTRAVAAGGEAGCNPFAAYEGPEMGEFVARNMFPDPAVREALERADTAGGLRNTGELGGAIFSQGLLSWSFARHHRLTMPVLVIAGERDFQIGLDPQRDLARRLPDARLLVYEGAGHFMYLDRPDRFVRDVTAFFGAAGERPARASLP
ncbi:MAG TPA: alpha/beta hydrolase [Longimicrobium sp.]|nr:alpha/beta hydrolase [Longimicrobium sp.]